MGEIVAFSRGAAIDRMPHAGLGKGQLGFLRSMVRATAHLTGRPLEDVTAQVTAWAGVADLREVPASELKHLHEMLVSLQRRAFAPP